MNDMPLYDRNLTFIVCMDVRTAANSNNKDSDGESVQ